MTCEEAAILLHALHDGELDAGHARAVEAHLAGCARCRAALQTLQDMRGQFADAGLRFPAPPGLARRIEARLPKPSVAAPDRRTFLKGLGVGAASAAMAASALLVVIRKDEGDRLLDDVVAAHIRSLDADHLLDVPSSDHHTVKPWFNGRLSFAPPVVDLTARGFTLIGGRLDYVGGKTAAALIYRRRAHVINLFVTEADRSGGEAAGTRFVQGFNIRRWTASGLAFAAVSDLNADELKEFAERFEGDRINGVS